MNEPTKRVEYSKELTQHRKMREHHTAMIKEYEKKLLELDVEENITDEDIEKIQRYGLLTSKREEIVKAKSKKVTFENTKKV